MSGIWIIAEVSGGDITPITYELLGAARALAEPMAQKVNAVLLGHEVASLAPALFARGADVVAVAEDPALAMFSPEGWSKVVGPFLAEQKPTVVLVGHSSQGKELAGRLAVHLQVAPVADCTQVGVENGKVVWYRPIFGGSMITTASAVGGVSFATIRPKAFAALPPRADANGQVLKISLPGGSLAPRTELVEVNRETGASVSLADADVICSGGRGVGAAERFAVIDQLAQELGAAVGASRAVVDAGWRPHKEQVGQTGRTVSPKLYIAAGISGAIQHLVGMRTSGTIVAINTDPEAPIMKVANVAVIGDLFEVIPEVISELKKLKTASAAR